MLKEIKETERTYYTSGIVYGYDWMNQPCGYEARAGMYKSHDEAEKAIIAAVKDGSLDAGFGFQRLVGASMSITELSAIEIDGKRYTHSETTAFDYGSVNLEEL